jgi:CRP-like cAMP-binding protein
MTARKSTAEALRALPLFQSLDEKGLEEIAELLIERKFPRDAVICEEGVAGDYMYLIQQGQVKVTKTSEDGREKILEIFAEGAFIGEMALLDREPRSASMKTTSACVLLALSRQDFLGLLRENSEIAMGVIRELSRRLRETDEQVRALMFERVEQRTRRVLRRLAREPHPERPELVLTGPVTHQQLADLVGTSRETVTRVLKALRDEGWLEQQGKRYSVRKDEDAV